MALSCCSSAASFFPLKHLQRIVPQPCLKNREALPLFPWALFPCCSTECVFLAKPVMGVRLPLCLCLLDKEVIGLLCHTGHTHGGKLAHTRAIQTFTHHISCICSTNICQHIARKKLCFIVNRCFTILLITQIYFAQKKSTHLVRLSGRREIQS